jgi:antitoxin YefM
MPICRGAGTGGSIARQPFSHWRRSEARRGRLGHVADRPTLGHNCDLSTESLREVRDHFSEVVDRVSHEHERVTVTRNGRPAAVILSPDDLAQLEETLEILSDPATLADLREADVAYRNGDVVRGIDAVRALRA